MMDVVVLTLLLLVQGNLLYISIEAAILLSLVYLPVVRLFISLSFPCLLLSKTYTKEWELQPIAYVLSCTGTSCMAVGDAFAHGDSLLYGVNDYWSQSN